MSKNRDDRTPADQEFLNEELENLYRKVAEEKPADEVSLKDVPLDESEFRREPGSSAGKAPAAKAGRSFNGADRIAKFFMFFIPAFLILGFAYFIWPTPHDYASVKHGDKNYLVKTNRFTGSKSYFYNGRWSTALPPDISLRMPDPLTILSSDDAVTRMDSPGAEENNREAQNQAAEEVQSPSIAGVQPPDPASLAEGTDREAALKETVTVKEEKDAARTGVKNVVKPEAVREASTPGEPVSRAEIAVPPAAKKSVKQALSKRKPYAVQVGAFRSRDDLNAFLQDHKGRSDMHWGKVRIKDQVWYRAFVGHFADREAAKRYMKKKKMENTYPGCFVQKAG